MPVVGELDSTVDRCQLLVNWIAQLWVPVGGELDNTVVGTS